MRKILAITLLFAACNQPKTQPQAGTPATDTFYLFQEIDLRSGMVTQVYSSIDSTPTLAYIERDSLFLVPVQKSSSYVSLPVVKSGRSYRVEDGTGSMVTFSPPGSSLFYHVSDSTRRVLWFRKVDAFKIVQ